MHSPIQELIKDNELKQVDNDLFEGSATPSSGNSAYGGQLMAQAVLAAQFTVPEAFVLHASHCFFFQPTPVNQKLIYKVLSRRDGNSYLYRTVQIYHRDELLFESTCSFQRPEDGITHQSVNMPAVPGFEQLISDRIRFKSIMPDSAYGWPLAFYHVDPVDLLRPEAAEPVNYIWCKTNGIAGDSVQLNQQLLAYAVDNPLLQTALRPHGLSFLDPGVRVGTINHATWFYRPAVLDYGILFEVHSEYSGGGRATSRTNIFDCQGNLVASAMQEGFVRTKQRSKINELYEQSL